MTDKDKPDIQNSGISNEPETAIQTPTRTEDKTLLRSDALVDESIDEPTRKFVAPVDAEKPTALQNAPDTEPTKIFSADKTDTDEPKIKTTDAPDENVLRPSRLRFALLCLLFVSTFVYAGINIYQAFLLQSTMPFILAREGDSRVIAGVRQGFEDDFQAGDVLVSVNGIEANYTANPSRFDALRFDKPGERRTIILRRNGQLREVETVSVSRPLSLRLQRILNEIFIPAMFLITGFLLFLLKPNDKQALLLALSFIAFLSIVPISVDLPLVLLVVMLIGLSITFFGAPLFLHFFLIFPERSTLLRRFPKLESRIYLPFLLATMPHMVLTILQSAGYSGLTAASARTSIYNVASYTYALYSLAGLLVLIFTYRQSGETARRKLRVLIAGLLCGFSPSLLYSIVVEPLLRVFEIRNPWQEWMVIILIAPLLLIPPVFAYAIVRHRVIPVSFVIRRGLQYLLAKNALRLLLVLPVLGIVWNIAANPNRTLSEILFQNSFAFYFFIALAVVDGVLMRSRLNEWIDRRFFREQYNQERVLHKLIEDISESDSMSKLSRLVSSRIQSALHPTSVYLFYEDKHESDFSTGYTTSENSDNLKLAADSPLLRFMQTKRGAVDFPLNEKNGLPPRELDWLRSIGANLLVPMHGTDGKLAGFFSLGEKRSEIPYTNRDKELLETLANQIALVQENLSLKDRMRHEQKIKTEVLSRFDEGNINLLKECPRCGKCFDRAVEKCDADNSELTFSLPVEHTIENRYRLEKLIGKGGMGAVYEATDTRINRTVAVKILSGAMFGNRDALRRFEREAQTAGRLQHKNIVTVFDYGVLSTEGAFLVMELVRGKSLSDYLQNENKINSATVKEWFAQVLDGVEAAHRAGIIHRDLKPDNIFVARNDNGETRLCILDFGIARLNETEIVASGNVTVPGTIMGTLGYMPPEQLRGERADERSDLFAVGVMIYEALHGEKPFRGQTYHELLTAMTQVIDYDLDKTKAKFFERSLAPSPENRFVSAIEMKQALSIL